MKIIHILSGGLDSTVLLYKLLEETDHIYCLSFDYGQKHIKEIDRARDLTLEVGVPHRVLDLGYICDIFGSNSLTGTYDIPNGHYTEKIMKTTVVPNRNMIFLSIAAALAISNNYDTLSYGAHAGDHPIYPDCRPEFVNKLNDVFNICDWNKIDLICPFVNLSKIDIVKMGIELNVPFEKTWTCYNGDDIPCQTCASCVERKEAFEKNNIKDPLSQD